MSKVHVKRADGSIPCGIGRRWKSQQITTVRGAAKATCATCVRLAK